MDIAGLAANGIDHDFIDQTNDRRIFGLFLEAGGVEFFFILDKFKLGVVKIGNNVIKHRRRVVKPVDCLLDGNFRGDGNLNIVTGDKFDVINCGEVGRVAYCDNQG